MATDFTLIPAVVQALVLALTAPASRAEEPGPTQDPTLARQQAEVRIHVFWQQGCPGCEGARGLLREMAAEQPDVLA